MFERSLPIGKPFGVELRLHWTMLLGVFYYYWSIRPAGAEELALLAALLLLLFGSVTLHELGHALAARRFGIATRRIVLWPLGGVALLERPPARPREELVISGAGPLANLLLAGVVALVGLGLNTFALGWEIDLFVLLGETLWPLYLPDFGARLVTMNLALAALNLLPIYPLDGGRMLRAAITMGLGQNRANRAMVVIGLPLAVGLLIYFVVQQQWLSAVIAMLLCLFVAQLNPRLRESTNLAFASVFNRGYYWFLCDDHQRAVEAYSAQIARRPKQLLIYHNRGAAYHSLKQYDLALADYDRVLAADPGRVKVYIDRAWLHVDRKAYDLALADVDRAAALRPDDPTSIVTRAVVNCRARDTVAALADLDRALAIDPQSAWAHNVRGLVLLHALDLDGAEAALTQAIALDPADAAAPTNRALLRHLRDDAACEADIARAIAANPKLFNALALRGVRRMIAGDLQGAQEDLDRAAELAPDDGELCWHRARLRHLRGDEAGADAEIARGLALGHEDACVHAPIELALYVDGDLPWALQYYERVIGHLPELAAAYHGRADALRVNHRPVDALADYDRAIALDGARAATYLGRALVRRDIGEDPTSDARRALELGLTPDERRIATTLLEPIAAPAVLL